MLKKVLALLVAVVLLVPVFAFAEDAYEPLKPMEETLTLKVVHTYDLSSAGDIGEGITPENGMWNDLVLQDLNIKFDWMWTVTSDQWDQKFQLSVAAGDIPDLLRLTDVQFRTFLDAASLRDLTAAYDRWTLKEMKAMDDALQNGPTKQATVDGKLMAVPRFEDTHSSMYLYFYRTDWAEKLGIAQPETIYDVMAMAEAFATKDPDGNGQDDTVGFGLSNSPFASAFGPLAFYQSFGGYPRFWIEKDGEVVPGIIQDETQIGLNALREMYAKGNNTVAKDFAALSGDQLNERVVASKVGVLFGMWWNPAYPLNQNLNVDKDAMWAVLPIPSTTAGEYGKSIENQNAVQFYNAVYTGAPANTEEALIKLLNYDYAFLAPVDPEIWPQKPIPMTKEEIDANLALSKEELLKGKVWNWLPVMTWPSNGNVLQAMAANEGYKAYKEGGLEAALPHLRTIGDKDWFDKTVAFYEEGKASDVYGNNWGIVGSRTDDNGGILTTVRLRDAGYVVKNVYYGAATETEQQVSSSLNTMAEEYFTKYIMGEVAEDSWDGFVADWLAQGGQDWWDEVKEGYALYN